MTTNTATNASISMKTLPMNGHHIPSKDMDAFIMNGNATHAPQQQQTNDPTSPGTIGAVQQPLQVLDINQVNEVLTYYRGAFEQMQRTNAVYEAFLQKKNNEREESDKESDVSESESDDESSKKRKKSKKKKKKRHSRSRDNSDSASKRKKTKKEKKSKAIQTTTTTKTKTKNKNNSKVLNGEDVFTSGVIAHLYDFYTVDELLTSKVYTMSKVWYSVYTSSTYWDARMKKIYKLSFSNIIPWEPVYKCVRVEKDGLTIFDTSTLKPPSTYDQDSNNNNNNNNNNNELDYETQVAIRNMKPYRFRLWQTQVGKYLFFRTTMLRSLGVKELQFKYANHRMIPSVMVDSHFGVDNSYSPLRDYHSRSMSFVTILYVMFVPVPLGNSNINNNSNNGGTHQVQTQEIDNNNNDNTEDSNKKEKKKKRVQPEEKYTYELKIVYVKELEKLIQKPRQKRKSIADKAKLTASKEENKNNNNKKKKRTLNNNNETQQVNPQHQRELDDAFGLSEMLFGEAVYQDDNIFPSNSNIHHHSQEKSPMQVVDEEEDEDAYTVKNTHFYNIMNRLDTYRKSGFFYPPTVYNDALLNNRAAANLSASPSLSSSSPHSEDSSIDNDNEDASQSSTDRTKNKNKNDKYASYDTIDFDYADRFDMKQMLGTGTNPNQFRVEEVTELIKQRRRCIDRTGGYVIFNHHDIRLQPSSEYESLYTWAHSDAVAGGDKFVPNDTVKYTQSEWNLWNNPSSWSVGKSRVIQSLQISLARGQSWLNLVDFIPILLTKSKLHRAPRPFTTKEFLMDMQRMEYCHNTMRKEQPLYCEQ